MIRAAEKGEMMGEVNRSVGVFISLLTVYFTKGAGESGKSTILKQMKLIHDGGYSRDEREAFKEIIFSNTVQSMRVILEAMENMGVACSQPQNRHHSTIILDLPSQIERESLPAEVTLALKSLWKDENLQSVFDRSREYQLNDSAK
jgi:guanine nucleotide-binding protein G(i) subunit alpha